MEEDMGRRVTKKEWKKQKKSTSTLRQKLSKKNKEKKRRIEGLINFVVQNDEVSFITRNL